MIRSFENIKEFMKQSSEIIQVLDSLAEYNLKFQKSVPANRARTLRMKKEEAKEVRATLSQMEKEQWENSSSLQSKDDVGVSLLEQ